MTAEDYAAQLAKLLPLGPIWRWATDSLLYGLLLAAGDALSDFDAACRQLPIETDPRTTTDLIDEWEASCGLPDGCLPADADLASRRSAVVSRLTATGGASPAYFVGLLAGIGYTATVEDLGPNHWRVNVAAAAGLVYTTCNGNCNDPLQTFGIDQIDCLIARLQPAHTQADIAYTG